MVLFFKLTLFRSNIVELNIEDEARNTMSRIQTANENRQIHM